MIYEVEIIIFSCHSCWAELIFHEARFFTFGQGNNYFGDEIFIFQITSKKCLLDQFKRLITWFNPKKYVYAN